MLMAKLVKYSAFIVATVFFFMLAVLLMYEKKVIVQVIIAIVISGFMALFTWFGTGIFNYWLCNEWGDGGVGLEIILTNHFNYAGVTYLVVFLAMLFGCIVMILIHSTEVREKVKMLKKHLDEKYLDDDFEEEPRDIFEGGKHE